MRNHYVEHIYLSTGGSSCRVFLFEKTITVLSQRIKKRKKKGPELPLENTTNDTDRNVLIVSLWMHGRVILGGLLMSSSALHISSYWIFKAYRDISKGGRCLAPDSLSIISHNIKILILTIFLCTSRHLYKLWAFR